MSPIADADSETPELLETDSARAYVKNERRLQQIREGSTLAASCDASWPHPSDKPEKDRWTFRFIHEPESL